MDEKDRKIQELTQENAKLRGWVVESVAKACFNCEEYRGHSENRCNGCPISRMKEGKR